jgi:hypothetical protein
MPEYAEPSVEDFQVRKPPAPTWVEGDNIALLPVNTYRCHRDVHMYVGSSECSVPALESQMSGSTIQAFLKSKF